MKLTWFCCFTTENTICLEVKWTFWTQQTLWFCNSFSFHFFLNTSMPLEFVNSSLHYLDRVKRIWYLSPMRAAKVQASLRIRAVSPEPPLLAHTSNEPRGTFSQKARSLAPLNGWACAVKICHDGMLEDTNSLDGAHLRTTKPGRASNSSPRCLLATVILSAPFCRSVTLSPPSSILFEHKIHRIILIHKAKFPTSSLDVDINQISINSVTVFFSLT